MRLGEIEAGAAAEGDDAVIAAVAVDAQALVEVQIGRVGIDLEEDRAAEACGFEHGRACAW